MKQKTKKNPWPLSQSGVWVRSPAVSYSHMGKPHTTIGAESFHFRVRDGIGWFQDAIAARQTVGGAEGSAPRHSVMMG